MKEIEMIKILLLPYEKDYRFEETVKDFFVEKGYIVKRGLGEAVSRNLGALGAPDFFVQRINEQFFVECKGKTDSLKRKQIKWICKNYQEDLIIVLAAMRNNVECPWIPVKKHDGEGLNRINDICTLNEKFEYLKETVLTLEQKKAILEKDIEYYYKLQSDVIKEIHKMGLFLNIKDKMSDSAPTWIR